MSNNQSGAAHLVAILLVVVIAAVGFIGWKVWDSQESKNNETTGESAEIKNNAPPVQATENTQKLLTNVFDCDGKFTVAVPEDMYSFRLDNGGSCAVSSTKQSELPAVGKHTGENVSFVFSTYPNISLALDAWAEKYFKDNETYPKTVISKEMIKLNNGQNALLVLTKGGHYNTQDYNLFYKKGNLGIFTDWDSGSKLSSKALEVVKTIN